MNELDDHAKEVLHTLRVGGHFSIKGVKGDFVVTEWQHPVELEPWVAAYQYENGLLTSFRAVRVSRVERVFENKVV